MADDLFAGPVNYLVVGFPDGASVGAGLRALLERVDDGSIELLTQLGELRSAGVLTDAEFETQKQRILAGG